MRAGWSPDVLDRWAAWTRDEADANSQVSTSRALAVGTLQEIVDWGPAEDWSDWTDTER